MTSREILTQDEVIALLRKRQGDKTNREFALELGIHETYLSQLVLKNRDLTDKVLNRLGLEKRTVYVPMRKAARRAS